MEKKEIKKTGLEVLSNQIGQAKVQLFDMNEEIKQNQNIYNQGRQQLQQMLVKYKELQKSKLQGVTSVNQKDGITAKEVKVEKK